MLNRLINLMLIKLINGLQISVSFVKSEIYFVSWKIVILKMRETYAGVSAGKFTAQ